ncbi:hypothetical protein [Nitrincola sp. A-D6]|uniref:hypothetical protein n=1 Tax=Nitrincola sp. A-D6 TaxID=1545442 RepID=UPI0013625216|nr:hypothetical protein [Nitrincola sp. A-D6]
MNKKIKAKFKYKLEYRQSGRWYPLVTCKTKEEAESYAATSYSCSNGYQIRKVKV